MTLTGGSDELTVIDNKTFVQRHSNQYVLFTSSSSGGGSSSSSSSSSSNGGGGGGGGGGNPCHRCSVLVQRFNVVLLLESLPVFCTDG